MPLLPSPVRILLPDELQLLGRRLHRAVERGFADTLQALVYLRRLVQAHASQTLQQIQRLKPLLRFEHDLEFFLQPEAAKIIENAHGNRPLRLPARARLESKTQTRGKTRRANDAGRIFNEAEFVQNANRFRFDIRNAVEEIDHVAV